MKNGWILMTVLIFSFFSCKEKKEGVDLKNVVNHFVQEHNASVYGRLDVFGIIEKGELNSLPVFGELVTEQVEQISEAIKSDEPIYFMLEGGISDDVMPESVFAFAAVQNKDSLISLFSNMGYFIEEEKGIHYSFDMNSAIGFNDQVLAMVTTDFEKDPEEEIRKVMESMNIKSKGAAEQDFFATEGDLFVTNNFGSFISNMDFSDFGANQADVDALKAKLEQAKSFTTLSFLKGEMNMTTSFDWAEAKPEFDVFNEVDQKEVLSKMKLANPMFALSTSLDIPKLEAMMKKYFPRALKEMYANLGTTGLILRGLGGEGMASLFSGKLVAEQDGIRRKFDVTDLPALSVSASVGDAGEALLDILLDLAGSGDLQKDVNGRYILDDLRLKMNTGELYMVSSKFDSVVRQQKGNVTSRFKDFGVTPISLYFDAAKMMNKNANLIDDDVKVIMKLIDYITLQGSIDKMSFTVVLKNKEQNILKQVLDAYQKQLQSIAEDGMMI